MLGIVPLSANSSDKSNNLSRTNSICPLSDNGLIFGFSFTSFGLVFVICHPSLVIRLHSPKVTRHTQELWLIGFPLSFDSMFPVPPNKLYSLFIRGNSVSIVPFNHDTYLAVTTRLINDKQYKTLFK